MSMPEHHDSPSICVQPFVSVILFTWMVLTNMTTIYCLMSSGPHNATSDTLHMDVIQVHQNECPEQYYRPNRNQSSDGVFCKLCRKCVDGQIAVIECSPTSDRVCRCKAGLKVLEKSKGCAPYKPLKTLANGTKTNPQTVNILHAGQTTSSPKAITKSSSVESRKPELETGHNPSSAGKPDWTDFYILTVSSTAVLFFTLSLVLLFLMAVMKARSWYLYRRIPGSGLSLRFQGWLARMPTFPLRSRSQVAEHQNSINPISIVMETEVRMEGEIIQPTFSQKPAVNHGKSGHVSKNNKASNTQFASESSCGDSPSHEDVNTIAIYLKNMNLGVCCARLELLLPKASSTIYITSKEDLWNTHNVVSHGLSLSDVNIVLGNPDCYCDQNRNRLTLHGCQDCVPDKFECAELSIPDVENSTQWDVESPQKNRSVPSQGSSHSQHKIAPSLALDSSEMGSLMEAKNRSSDYIDFLEVTKLYQCIIMSLTEKHILDETELNFKSTIVVNLKSCDGKPMTDHKFRRVKRREGRKALPQSLHQESRRYRSPHRRRELDWEISHERSHIDNVGVINSETQCPRCHGESVDEWGEVVRPGMGYPSLDENIHPSLPCNCSRGFFYSKEGVLPHEKNCSYLQRQGNGTCLHCQLYDPHRIYHVRENECDVGWDVPMKLLTKPRTLSLTNQNCVYNKSQEESFSELEDKEAYTDQSSPTNHGELVFSDHNSDGELSIQGIALGGEGLSDLKDAPDTPEEGTPLLEKSDNLCDNGRGVASFSDWPLPSKTVSGKEVGSTVLSRKDSWRSDASASSFEVVKYTQTKV